MQFCVAQIPALARIPIMLKAKWARPSLIPPINYANPTGAARMSDLMYYLFFLSFLFVPLLVLIVPEEGKDNKKMDDE